MDENKKEIMDREKNKEKFLKSILDKKLPGFQEHAPMALLIDSIEKLRKSTEESSQSANRLAKRILWLNVILALATVVGTFAAIWIAFID